MAENRQKITRRQVEVKLTKTDFDKLESLARQDGFIRGENKVSIGLFVSKVLRQTVAEGEGE